MDLEVRVAEIVVTVDLLAGIFAQAAGGFISFVELIQSPHVGVKLGTGNKSPPASQPVTSSVLPSILSQVLGIDAAFINQINLINHAPPEDYFGLAPP